MAQTGYTPIYLYYSGTATHIPLAANLGAGELAINAADGNLFYKNTSNAVVTIPVLQSSATQNGWLSSTDWTTFNGKASAFTYTAGYIPFGQGTTTPNQSSNLFWDSTNNALGIGTTTPSTGGTGALTGISQQFYKNGANAIVAGVADTSGNTIYSGQVYSSTANATILRGYRFRGTVASPTSASSGDPNLFIQGIAYDGTAARTVTQIGSHVQSAVTTNDISGYINFSTRDNGVGTALTEVARFTSGKNLQFSSAAGGVTFNSGASSLLNDYEEGTWTPTVYGGTTAGSTGYVAQAGHFTKVGRVVNFRLYVQWNSQTGSGNLIVGGLPYTSATTYYPTACSVITSNLTFTANSSLSGSVADGGTTITISQSVNNAATTTVQIDTDGVLTISGMYFT